MVYIRGNTADYDGWVDEGAPGWSYGEMLPYFIKSEGNERGDARYHGHAGPMSVQDGRSVHPLVDRLIDAALSSGYRASDDFNAASQLGAGRFQLTQRNGVRYSAASAYLHPARERANLHVFTDALVLRLDLQRAAQPASACAVTVATRRFWQREKSFSRPARMDPRRSSCSPGSGPRSSSRRSVSPPSSIFRSEATFRTTRCCL